MWGGEGSGCERIDKMDGDGVAGTLGRAVGAALSMPFFLHPDLPIMAMPCYATRPVCAA